jgi:hypothetical protein
VKAAGTDPMGREEARRLPAIVGEARMPRLTKLSALLRHRRLDADLVWAEATRDSAEHRAAEHQADEYRAAIVRILNQARMLP